MQAARAFALTGGLLLHFYEVTNGPAYGQVPLPIP